VDEDWRMHRSLFRDSPERMATDGLLAVIGCPQISGPTLPDMVSDNGWVPAFMWTVEAPAPSDRHPSRSHAYICRVYKRGESEERRDRFA